MAKKIGDALRESRLKAGMSVEQISDILTRKGYKASIKTIYSWENGNSNPGPDALLEMCGIYKIDNVLGTFGYTGYNDDGSIQLNIKEIQHIEKYRSLDDPGRIRIDTVLNWEIDHATQLKEATDRIGSLEQAASRQTPILLSRDPAPDYLAVNAAHADDYANSPEDLKRLEEDIMDDENF